MGRAYDEERGYKPYRNGVKGADFNGVKAFFNDSCCYCGVQFSGTAAVQDHLIAMNKKTLGLHAWGNIVPACGTCNARKLDRDWKEFIQSQSGPKAKARINQVKKYQMRYEYAPDLNITLAAEELYEEVGVVAMALITAKVRRVRKTG